MFAKDLGQLLEAHLILSGLVGGVGIFGNTQCVKIIIFVQNVGST